MIGRTLEPFNMTLSSIQTLAASHTRFLGEPHVVEFGMHELLDSIDMRQLDGTSGMLLQFVPAIFLPLQHSLSCRLSRGFADLYQAEISFNPVHVNDASFCVLFSNWFHETFTNPFFSGNHAAAGWPVVDEFLPESAYNQLSSCSRSSLDEFLVSTLSRSVFLRCHP